MFIAHRHQTPCSRWIESGHVYRNVAFIFKGDSHNKLVHDYAKMMMAEELAATAPTLTGR
jgi:hypothetical protein